MFSQTNEYALRIITFLGADPRTPATHASIAEMTQVPAGYLYKVLGTLEKAGLVRSQRGKHGGYALNRPASEISVFDVVQAVDPLPRILKCPLHLKAHGVHLCPLHQRLDQAFALIEDTFKKSSIADLLTDQPKSTPMCDGPVPRKVGGKGLTQLTAKSLKIQRTAR